MDDYQNFSSWRPDQERQFVVFERTTQQNARSARTIAMIAAGATFLVLLVTIYSFDKPKPMLDEPEEELGAERAAAPAAAPTPTPPPADPAAAPAAADPAAATATAGAPVEATAPGATAPAAEAPATAPPPPPGATKAPPTALIKK